MDHYCNHIDKTNVHWSAVNKNKSFIFDTRYVDIVLQKTSIRCLLATDFANLVGTAKSLDVANGAFNGTFFTALASRFGFISRH